MSKNSSPGRGTVHARAPAVPHLAELATPEAQIAQGACWHSRGRMASMLDICTSADGNNLWFVVTLLVIVGLNLLLSMATVCLVMMRG